MGLKNEKDDPARYGGRGLAIGGIVAGGLGLVLSILIIVLALIANIK